MLLLRGPPTLEGRGRTVRVFVLKNADTEKLRGIVVASDADTLEEIRKLVTKLDEPAKKK